MSARDEQAGQVRVLIVEDHRVVAEGLAALLAECPDITITGIAYSVADVIPALEKAAADIAVIDYHLPDGTAHEAADRVRSRSPSTPIVVLTADAGSEPLLAALELGASGYMLKSATGEEIVKTILAAAAGENAIPAEDVTRALALYREGAQQRAHEEQLEGLTPREKEILALMAEGADNRAVAESLQISYATVRSHVRSILPKLGARSRLEAVARATAWGFRRWRS
jgi:DNA-binding NarL/FixJ family response regulator